MPPLLATLICILFMTYLFWTDRKRSDGTSNALWIPFFWMFLAGSRVVSSWFNLQAPMRSAAEAYSEGSPVDAAAFLLLIAAGVFVLARRNIDWGQLMAENKWIWLYFMYCGISIVWCDYPYIILKKFIKELGNPIMVLVILTEKHSYKAVGITLRRLAFSLLPLSVLFVKYYPELGRAYTAAGGQMYTGVGHQKNDLGLMCLISGIYFAWDFLLKQKNDLQLKYKGIVTDYILIGMVIYLLYMSKSATSIACLVVAVGLFLTCRTRLLSQQPGRVIPLMIVLFCLITLLNEALDVRGIVFQLLGRDETLTGRLQIWTVVKEFVTNPIVGTGFMSFWAGERGEEVLRTLSAGINQAHNGYVEQYLNLGYIGVAFIGVIMMSGLLKVRRHLDIDYPSAVLRLCFIVIAVLYNYTEASFYGINNMWTLLLVGCIETPREKVAVVNSLKLESLNRN